MKQSGEGIGAGFPAAGTLINDRYKIIAKLGSGGMGTVYSAHEVNLNRDVSLKFLHPWIPYAGRQPETL